MLHHCEEKIYIIDFGMANQHSNDLSEYRNSGRVQDTQDVAALICQLVMAPTPALESGCLIAILIRMNEPKHIQIMVYTSSSCI